METGLVQAKWQSDVLINILDDENRIQCHETVHCGDNQIAWRRDIIVGTSQIYFRDPDTMQVEKTSLGHLNITDELYLTVTQNSREELLLKGIHHMVQPPPRTPSPLPPTLMFDMDITDAPMRHSNMHESD